MFTIFQDFSYKNPHTVPFVEAWWSSSPPCGNFSSMQTHSLITFLQSVSISAWNSLSSFSTSTTFSFCSLMTLLFPFLSSFLISSGLHSPSSLLPNANPPWWFLQPLFSWGPFSKVTRRLSPVFVPRGQFASLIWWLSGWSVSMLKWKMTKMTARNSPRELFFSLPFQSSFNSLDMNSHEYKPSCVWFWCHRQWLLACLSLSQREPKAAFTRLQAVKSVAKVTPPKGRDRVGQKRTHTTKNFTRGKTCFCCHLPLFCSTVWVSRNEMQPGAAQKSEPNFRSISILNNHNVASSQGIHVC